MTREDRPGFRIRPAVHSDADRIEALHRATHAEHVAREAQYRERPFHDRFVGPLRARRGAALAGWPSFVLVGLAGTELAGYAACKLRACPDGTGLITINDLTVAPGHRRTGLGRALVEAVEQRAAEIGLSPVAAHVWPRNAASQALFRNLGFRPAAQEGLPFQTFVKPVAPRGGPGGTTAARRRPR